MALWAWVLGAAATAVASFTAGAVMRAKRARGTSGCWWSIDLDGATLDVLGPFVDEHGQVQAMRPSEQLAWAEQNGGRLPTATEFDQIWEQADVQVRPVPRDVVTAPLTALNADVAAALAASSTPDTDRIAAGKTWLAPDGNDNYGWLVPKSETAISNVDGLRYWHGLRVYPTTLSDAFAIQPVSDFHAGTDHVDYSQLGYAVRDA